MLPPKSRQLMNLAYFQVKRKREDTTKEDYEVEESNPPPTKRRSHKLYTPNVLDEEKENQGYECDKCPNPKKFFRKDAYDRHLANVHDWFYFIYTSNEFLMKLKYRIISKYLLHYFSIF